MARGVNATSVLSATVADTNDHFLPDTPGGADAYDIRTWDRAAVFVTNEADQEATVQLQGAAFDDPEFNNPLDLGSSEAAAAGGGSVMIPVQEAGLVSYLRVKVSFATAPTGNNPVTAKFQTDNDS